MVLGVGLRQLQKALDRKADKVQREFLRLSEELEQVNAALVEAKGEGRQPLIEEQRHLRQRQLEVAEKINVWRERARSVTQTSGERKLRELLQELTDIEDENIKAAVERTMKILDTPPEERDVVTQTGADDEEQTPVGRLLERARTEYDLRLGDPAHRRRAASEFANRPGLAQDDSVFEELRAAQDDPDPLVRELVTLTLIQLHRFRVMRFADLDLAHQSVQELARMKSREVIPVLAEILQNPRTGFVNVGEDEAEEAQNTRSRLVALLRLVEWHTPQAKAAVRSVRFDQQTKIANAAERALELFPDAWTGPLKKSGLAQESD